MAKIYKLYYSFPPVLKNIAASGISFLKAKQKYGPIYKKFYNFLLHNNFDTTVEEELEAFLKHARQYSRFYSDIKANDINDFPVITKQDIIVSNYANQVGHVYKTTYSSGTTGQPFRIPVTKEAYQREYAFWWFHRSFAGLKRGDPVATIAGHKVADVLRSVPPFWVHNYHENQLIFSSYHLSPENIPYYIKALNKFKPKLIHGYPSSIYLLARYALDNNIKFEFIPSMIQTASETTLDFQRSVIEQAFQSKVFIWYGNTELCGHITECAYGKLHVQERHSFVRILTDKNEDALPGQEGRIVATNFNNYCFPLINYDTKDVVKIATEQSCRCGQSGLVVERIDGRIEDYIILPDGRRTGRLDHIFKKAKHVQLAQIEQKSIEEIVIHIKKDEFYNTKDENSILDEARNRLGDSINIIISYESDIFKESNGKFRFIKQHLNTRDLK
ncbi:MAG: AMP-binding protein [Calditrichia bacterium]